MQVVILAGGMGTRLSEETEIKPKPMIEIGGKPILWHIMKIYAHYGHADFIVCLGYKGYLIKEYFHHYFMHLSDVTIDLKNNNIAYLNSKVEPWKITLIDTGTHTMTGGRLKRIEKYIGANTFMLTYGDGIGSIDIEGLIKTHNASGKAATLTAVQPMGRFGSIDVDENNVVKSFQEKPMGDGAWINAGFFVLDRKVFSYITGGDQTVWEKEPLEYLAKDGQLNAYRHHGFWKPMDTLRDKKELESMWDSSNAAWKIWND